MNKKGFTIIELIVVIAIIAVLSGIVVGSVNKYQAKARDARRNVDMNTILKALTIFQTNNGCMPITSGTTCPGAIGYVQAETYGFDWSSQGGDFLPFLVPSGILSKVPLDPINNMTGGDANGQYAYRYYCYTESTKSWNEGYTGLKLEYWKEAGGWARIAVVSGGSGSSFICK